MRRYARVDPPQTGDGDGLGGPWACGDRRRQPERAEMGLEEFWFVLIGVLWAATSCSRGSTSASGCCSPSCPAMSASAA